jgi:peptide/nickel transport system permease protein
MSASPAALIWGRVIASLPARCALGLVATVFLLGVYAPFLATDACLVWHDTQGWRLPAVSALFNRATMGKPHDLVFNLLALGLPLLTVLWVALRRWSVSRRLGLGALLLVLATVGCALPLVPGPAGLRPLWRDRPVETATVSARDAGQGWGVAAPIPRRADATTAGAILLAPGERDPVTGSRFWLGTDSAGKDVAAQMLSGARISLTVGLVATGLSLFIGLLIGALSGYLGGWIDLILQRLVEIMMCFPTFILILVVVALTGRDLFVIMTVIGLTSWAGTARLVRGEFLAQRVRDYVAGAEALGLGRTRIMFRHILPNACTPLVISATFMVAGAVGSEAGLSFLGLGDPTVASWGALLEQGRQNIRYAWLIYAPGLAVFALVLALNVIGGALRDALDPR